MTDANFPSFLAFLGYAFYFPGFLVGPFLEYAEYDALVSEKLFSSIEAPEHLKEQLAESRSKRAVPPGRKRVAYVKMMIGLGFLGLYVFFFPKFNFMETIETWFLRKGLLERWGIHQAIVCMTLMSLQGLHITKSLDSLRGPNTMQSGL